jgi:hypothetical protein
VIVKGVKEGGQVTFGFRLMADLTRGEHLSSDEQGMEIDLPAPIGPVTLQAGPGRMPTSKAQVFIFSGQGYALSEEALQAGHALKNAIRLAAVEVGSAIDVGQDVAHGRPGQVVIEEFAKRGFQLLPEVHGLHVYEETGIPTVLMARAEGTAVTPLGAFTDALHTHAGESSDVTEKRALACDLFVQSRFESSPKSRHLTLVTALEVLSQRRERSGRAVQLVEEFREAIKKALREADPAEKKELESLLGASNDLRSESISAAIRRLAESVPSSGPIGDADPGDLVRTSYDARSQLTHDGVTSHDLTALLGPLEALVRQLVLHPEWPPRSGGFKAADAY